MRAGAKMGTKRYEASLLWGLVDNKIMCTTKNTALQAMHSKIICEF